MPRPVTRRRGGFTLIEMIISITVLGVLAAVGGGFILEGVKSWQQFTFRSDTGLQARLAMDWMVREIRETDAQSLGAPIINAASATTYDFMHTLEGGTNEQVAFSWNGAAGAPLLRNTATLVPKVNSLTFAYYDQNDALLSPLPLSSVQRDSVRRVVVTMTIQNDVLSYTMKIKGEAFLRAAHN